MKAENQSTKTTFKVSFFLKKTKIRKNGNAPIIARISVNGEQAHFSTKLEIEPEKWSLETMSAKGRNAEALKINNILEGIKASINKNYHDLQYKEGSVTAVALKNNFLGIYTTHESLLSLFDKHLEELNELVSIRQIIYNTYIVYKSICSQLTDFIKLKYKFLNIPINLTTIKIAQNSALDLIICFIFVIVIKIMCIKNISYEIL